MNDADHSSLKILATKPVGAGADMIENEKTSLLYLHPYLYRTTLLIICCLSKFAFEFIAVTRW